MRIKNRVAALALLCASVAVAAPALAGAGVAQAAVTPGAHDAVAHSTTARAPIPGLVSVSAAPRAAVSPNIIETPCNTYANSADFYMHGSLDCAEFLQKGSTDTDLANVYQVNSQLWAGSFEYLYGGYEYRMPFTPWEVIKFNENILVISITITN